MSRTETLDETDRSANAVLAPLSPSATAGEDPGDEREPEPARRTGLAPGAVPVLVTAGAAALYGLLARIWLLAHLPVWGDEAIVGIMGRAIGAGHFSAFYWGQNYGGLEPYLVAAALKLGGGGEPALNGTPAVLSALAAVLVGVITLAVGRNRLLALAAGCAVWVWPYVAVWQSVREGGFRQATLCCGLTAILCCVRAYRRRAGPFTFLLLGVSLGLGWWASPEIAYFVLPCLVLLIGWWRNTTRDHGPDVRGAAATPGRWSALALVAGGGVVGSLPWWYANTRTGFASLQRSALPANGGATYWSKLSVFFHDALPMQLGARTVLTGAWVGGPTLGRVLYVLLLVLVGAAVVCAVWVARAQTGGLVPLAVAVAVVSYPFVYAAAPGTGFWLDGRYGLYIPALVVVMFGALLAQAFATRDVSSACVATTEMPQRPAHVGRKRARVPGRQADGVLVLAAFGVAGAFCLGVAGAHAAGVPTSTAFFSGWRSGDDPIQQAVDSMRAHHITDAYGDYWTAYDLDFLSRGEPLVSPNRLLDVTRSTAMAEAVASSKDPAWLFFAPAHAAEAGAVFLNPQPGPGPYTEESFEARLQQLGVRYQVVHLGVLDAVVPSRRVTAP